MPDEKAVPLEFPVQGIDVSCEYGRQPPGTTPAAVNVRGFEPTTDRQRGGSRSGSFRLVRGTVGGLASGIQHLAIVVDPTTPGLLAAFDAAIAPSPNIPDPSTNNAAGGSTDPNDPLVRNPDRTVRAGGSGVQPNRHLPAGPAASVQFVQGKGATPGFVSGVTTLDLDSPPNIGDLVVVVAETNDFSASTARVTGVTNGAGDPFANVGGGSYYAEVSYPDNSPMVLSSKSLSMWYKVASGGSDLTIKVTTGGSANVEFMVLVYRGPANLGPLTDKAKTETTPSLAIETTFAFSGLNLNGTSNQLVVAGFIAYDTDFGQTLVTANYNARDSMDTPPVPSTSGIAVIDRLNATGVGPESATLSGSDFEGYIAIAASFHR